MNNFFYELKMLFYRAWVILKSRWYLRSVSTGRRVRVHGRVNIKNDGEIEIGSETNFHRGKAWTEIFVSKDSYLQIGSQCKINKGCNFFVTRNVYIGDRCKLGWNVSILDNHFHMTNVSRRSTLPMARRVVICEDAWIGSNSTIMPGVTIGPGAIVCAGSVVTKDVLPMTMVGGVPARYIKDVEP